MAERRGLIRVFSMIFPMLASVGRGEYVYYDHQTTSRLGDREKFGFNLRREKLRAIKNRRRTGRR